MTICKFTVRESNIWGQQTCMCCTWYVCMWYTDMHACKTHIHMKESALLDGFCGCQPTSYTEEERLNGEGRQQFALEFNFPANGALRWSLALHEDLNYGFGLRSVHAETKVNELSHWEFVAKETEGAEWNIRTYNREWLWSIKRGYSMQANCPCLCFMPVEKYESCKKGYYTGLKTQILFLLYL